LNKNVNNLFIVWSRARSNFIAHKTSDQKYLQTMPH